MAQGKFTQGSIIKHVMTMSATNALGISMLFLVDLVDIYFISLLENPSLTAAIGYASPVLFFTISLSIALVIVNSAIVARKLGQQKRIIARQFISLITLYAFTLTSVIAFLLYYFAPQILQFIGAQGEELKQATLYLHIILPSMPILAVALQMGATLRSMGHAKQAMFATLGAGLINAALDPILIFYFKLDLQGAAIASVAARCTLLVIGLYYVQFKYRMIATINSAFIRSHFLRISQVALPAILSQITTPISNFYVTYEIAKFGSQYMAGWAIIGRIVPVVFVMMFALSGAIGPIISQNYGAHNFTRVREVLNQSMKFITSYTLVVALFMSMGQEIIVMAFKATDETASLIRIFCQNIPITFIFTGMMLITMTLLNNLGHAKYATLLTLLKLTLGTIPCVIIGSYYFHAPGVIYGQAAANIIFGVIALTLSNKRISKLSASPSIT
ncbi:MATE family efflux transporter [Psychromonas sp. MME2]|uniref:MATE family efflux transporter n=1 Tax=unclassified Psychromonas TaxID=2614957 RepID=UPI00339BF485